MRAEAEGLSESLKADSERRARVFNNAVKAAVGKVQRELEAERDELQVRAGGGGGGGGEGAKTDEEGDGGRSKLEGGQGDGGVQGGEDWTRNGMSVGCFDE